MACAAGRDAADRDSGHSPALAAEFTPPPRLTTAFDTAAGQDAHWCLVSEQVSRAGFERLDLGRVDPMHCLAYLYAPHHKVDIAAVREIIGSISQREFTKGIIITTSGFTAAARQEAERLGVELYDGQRLLWLLRHHPHREYTIIDQGRRKPPFRKPPGPGAGQ